jgi:hypothetical protein
VKVAAERRASLGVRLLADLRTIFGDADALHTRTILERLHAGEEHGLEPDAPWADLHGKPIAERGLASMLKKYGINPAKVRESGAAALQGYRRADLHDAWTRYLTPSPSPKEAEHPEQAEQTTAADDSVPDVPDVPDATGSVRCRDCLNLDGEAGLCREHSRPVDPHHARTCVDFRAQHRSGTFAW